MTSGDLFANVYAFTVGPLVASLILGTFTGLAIVVQLRIQSICSSMEWARTSSIPGLGLLATVGASSAGLLGCHGGSGMSGGILAITGLSPTTASLLASFSPYIQVALIVALAGYCIHLHRKMRQTSAQLRSIS